MRQGVPVAMEFLRNLYAYTTFPGLSPVPVSTAWNATGSAAQKFFNGYNSQVLGE